MNYYSYSTIVLLRLKSTGAARAMAYLDFKPTGSLAHYTSIHGFFGIVETKRLWLSDLSSSNDPRESMFGKEIYDNIFQEIIYSEFSQSRSTSLDYFRDILQKQVHEQNFYSCCFTYDPDDINMWREYAHDGSGLSIVFRRRAITDMIGRFYQMRYVSEISVQEAAQIILETLKPIDQVGDDIFDDFESTVDLVSSSLAIMQSFKHVSWASEREMRLTFASSSNPASREMPRSVYPDGRYIFWSPPLTREGRNGTVEFYPQEFGAYRDSAYEATSSIERVYLGPNCALSANEVSAKLLTNGFRDFEICHSVCAFR
jgi:hypothetical protein